MPKSAIVHIWINLSRICKKKNISQRSAAHSRSLPFFNHVTSLPLTTAPHRILKNIITYWNIGLGHDNIIISYKLYVISSWSFGRTLLVVRSYVSVVRSYVRSYLRSFGRTFGRTFGRSVVRSVMRSVVRSVVRLARTVPSCLRQRPFELS